MKTLKEVLAQFDKFAVAEIISKFSRYKKNGDLVVSCWGASIYSEEAIPNLMMLEERLEKRRAARNINLSQWSDTCEGYISLASQGFPVEEFVANSGFRCYSCGLLYNNFHERISSFYRKHRKFPTLVWDNTLKFQEEIEKETENKNIKLSSQIADNYIYDTCIKYNWGDTIDYEKVFYKK